MSKPPVMTPELAQLLELSIAQRYPDLAHLHHSVEITSKNPWAGRIQFHSEQSSSSANFEFYPDGRSGQAEPNLYISSDWND